MKIRAEMGRKHGPLWPMEYAVDKVTEIPNSLFNRFMSRPLDRYKFIEHSHVEPHQGDGFNHCLLVLCEGRDDGVLVQCSGYGDASLMAYMPGVRNTVQAKLDQAVDFIVRQGTKHTASGYWCVYCEELAEKLDLTIPEDSGLDAMLKDTLERRPEIAAVSISNGAIETTFRPESCVELCDSAAEEKSGVRLRDILPLLPGGGRTFLCHKASETSVSPENLRELTGAGREDFTALLDARVTEIVPTAEGTEVMLTDVEPQELARFNQEYAEHQEAERAMGPVMGGLS